ncbi:hypothetical protein Trydic_g15609 [Trypoxylus dichotomus]
MNIPSPCGGKCITEKNKKRTTLEWIGGSSSGRSPTMIVREKVHLDFQEVPRRSFQTYMGRTTRERHGNGSTGHHRGSRREMVHPDFKRSIRGSRTTIPRLKWRGQEEDDVGMGCRDLYKERRRRGQRRNGSTFGRSPFMDRAGRCPSGIQG